MVNLNGSHSDVKVYTVNGAAPGSASSLPDWLTKRRAGKGSGKKRSAKQEFESAIDLIQDFEFPEASNKVKTTRDGHHVLATGTYKPCMRLYDLDQLTLKFERHTNAENIDFLILSDDWTKTLHLQDNRCLEFHNQSGLYYSTRVPRMGRSLAYHYPSCDALMGCVGNEVYRLNLDQGRFLNSLVLSEDVEGVNAIDVNPAHQLLAFGSGATNGGDGTVEFWDPRSRNRVGVLVMPGRQLAPVSVAAAKGGIGAKGVEVTALSSRSDGLSLAVGTSTGHTLLYDLRSPHYYAVKDQGYGLPMKNVIWVEGGAKMAGDGMVISADNKVIKVWDRNSPSVNFASITPSSDINHVHHVPSSGLMMCANESTRLTSYYIPQLGPAPRWCSFLDHITEEMEESATRTVYEDYKFVERSELTRLGLDHLVGTKACKPYMHGFFISLRLYDAARLISNPFAYEEHREQLVKEKVEKLVESRIRTSKNGIAGLPQVNRALAEKLQRDWEKRTSVLKRKREKADSTVGAEDRKNPKDTELEEPTNPLMDPRFKEMFENPEFEVDVESREYGMLNPGGSATTSTSKKRRKTAVELEAEQSAVSSSSDGMGRHQSSSSSSSSEEDDDSEADNQLVDMARFKRLKESGVKFRPSVNEAPGDEPIVQSKEKEKAMLEAYPHFKKFMRQQNQASTNARKLVTASAGLAGSERNDTFGERAEGGLGKGENKADEMEEEDVEFEGVDGFEMTWTSAPESKKEVAKKKKGAKSFGAGLESGGVDDQGLAEGAQKQGRTKKRHTGGLRSAGKNTFRKLSAGR
ncbi:hypothetical protein FRC00_008187 [Tulasnella sp. 408]|nr:hypothetical protein FRC00_008187 [Tulasnella sp. 408]